MFFIIFKPFDSVPNKGNDGSPIQKEKMNMFIPNSDANLIRDFINNKTVFSKIPESFIHSLYKNGKYIVSIKNPILPTHHISLFEILSDEGIYSGSIHFPLIKDLVNSVDFVLVDDDLFI